MQLRSKKAIGKDFVGELGQMSKAIEDLALASDKGYGDSKVKSLVLEFNSASAQAIEVINGDKAYDGIKDEVKRYHEKSKKYMEKVTKATSQLDSPQG